MNSQVSQDSWLLARTRRDLELFEMPFNTPTMLAAGTELLWWASRGLIMFQGRTYQFKPQDREALELVSVEGKPMEPSTSMPAIDEANNDNNQKCDELFWPWQQQSYQYQQAQTAVQSPAELDPAFQHLPLLDRVWIKLRQCYDPEIAVNIVELGLIYDLQLLPMADADPAQPTYQVLIKMTFTNPACSMGDLIIAQIKNQLATLAEIAETRIEIVFDPPWSYERLSTQAKLELGVL